MAGDPVKRESYLMRIWLHDAIDAIVELCRLDGSYKQKPMSVAVAPITSVTVAENARTKLAAIMNKLPFMVAVASKKKRH